MKIKTHCTSAKLLIYNFTLILVKIVGMRSLRVCTVTAYTQPYGTWIKFRVISNFGALQVTSADASAHIC